MTTPPPNTPLTSEDVTLLKAGDLCRDLTGQLYTVEREANDKYAAPVQVVGGTMRLFMVLGDKFIGRPEPDGWIPAPEGGWAENPVPGQRVEVRLRYGSERAPQASESLRWTPRDEPDPWDIIAFRLASLSPAASATPQFLATEDGEFNGPSTDPGREATEAVAKLVYEAMTWAAQRAETGKVPAWVDGGNAFAQDCARGLVPRIKAALSSQEQAPATPASFDDWMETLRTDVIQDEYGYEDGEFSAAPDDWRPLFDEGLTPSAAFKRALEAHATPATEPGGGRERIARLIFPEADRVKMDREWGGNRSKSRAAWKDALAKADTILAALPNQKPVEGGAGAANWSDHEDDLSDAIQDSIDMDWTSRDGAKAVIRWLQTFRLSPVEGGAIVTGVRLDGQQGEPAGMMRVTLEFSDGREVAAIQDNGNVISHWASVAARPSGLTGSDAVASAAAGIDDDYMTSEGHHPGYVLIPTAKFEAIRNALAALAPVSHDGGVK